MKTSLACIALLAVASGLPAGDKPVVYNHADDPPSKLDQQVTSALTPRFTVVDVPSGAAWVSASYLAGELPTTAKTKDGEELSGYALVAYVVTAEGLASEPVVIETTEPRLQPFIAEAMRGWRFTPATLDGRAVADAVAQEFDFVSKVHVAPTEFVTQVLEPTGGKIDRPKAWFYAENHDEHSYRWILSRERPVHGYETGMQIQVFTGMQKNLGKSAKQFALDYLADRRKQPGVKVLQAIDETPPQQQLFTRRGLETEEGEDHILYSVFWLTGGSDLAVITTVGTRKDLWPIYAPTFDRMSQFELIDMTRFPK